MLSLYGRGILQQRVLLSELVWEIRCRCGPSVVSNTTPTPLCDSGPVSTLITKAYIAASSHGVVRWFIRHRWRVIDSRLFFLLVLSLSHATSLHVFCWLFLFSLVHAGVPTSLNSAMATLWAFLKASLRRRLLLNAETDFCWKSHLPGSSRAPSTFEPPACRFPGPCASASNFFSADTHQHLLDLPVASTAPSESSAPVLSFHCLPIKMFWSLLSRRLFLSKYWLLYPSKQTHATCTAQHADDWQRN